MSLTHTLYPKSILHRLFYVHYNPTSASGCLCHNCWSCFVDCLWTWCWLQFHLFFFPLFSPGFSVVHSDTFPHISPRQGHWCLWSRETQSWKFSTRHPIRPLEADVFCFFRFGVLGDAWSYLGRGMSEMQVFDKHLQKLTTACCTKSF